MRIVKVAIIPLKYDELNYGGVLQFYALQKTIKKLGFNIEILKVDAETKVCIAEGKRTITTKIKRLMLKAVSPVLRLKNRRKIEKYIR